MSSPRILVLSASVGAGHVRAGQALEAAVKLVAPGAECRHVDVLTLMNALFRRLYGKAYLDLVNRAPQLLGALYDLSDKPLPRTGPKHEIRHLVQRANLSRLVALLQEGWDVVVNTHFLPADLIATLDRKPRKDRVFVRQVTVVTDFDTHAFWVNEPCERWFVAGEEAALSLSAWGIDRARITITGIPIDPVFAAPKARDVCREAHRLPVDRPVVLLLGGGFGVGPVAKIYARLFEVSRPIHIAVVCGRNIDLQKQLSLVPVPDRHSVTILGFTTKMDELLAAADLVVTKPGGLTTSESLARHVPMVIMNPIPGQESRNSDMLLEHGAAIKVNSLSALSWKIDTLLADSTRLASMRRHAAAIATPRAALDVAERVIEMARGTT